MPVNNYFNHHQYKETQDLYESLCVEAIQQRGIDVYYCPKIHGKLDYLFGEDTALSFDNAVTIEVLQDPADTWEGSREQIAKFGFEVQDKIKIYLSRLRFNQLVTSKYPTILKPREGDLIAGLFSANQLWEIDFVDDEISGIDFYHWGKLFVWELSISLYAYDQAELNTGIAEIDSIKTNLAQTEETGIDNIEDQADNKKIENEAVDSVIDFSEKSPFGDF